MAGGAGLIKIEEGGRVIRGGGAGEGRAPGECLWGRGRGVNIYFSGPNCPPSLFIVLRGSLGEFELRGP